MVGLVVLALAQANLERVEEDLARAVRAEVEMMTMMVHGLTAHTQDVSSFIC